jgi:hypothetical protein
MVRGNSRRKTPNCPKFTRMNGASLAEGYIYITVDNYKSESNASRASDKRADLSALYQIQSLKCIILF